MTMSIKTVSAGSAGSAVGLHLITGGTNATPIVATFAANNGLKSGDRVAISGITGLTAMNGEWELEAVTATTFRLLGSVGNGTYGGTPLCALIFDKTPLMDGHSAALVISGNLVGTLLIQAYEDYASFAASSNASGGFVSAPVVSSSLQGITNVNATSASTATPATSSIVLAATNAALVAEMKLSRYMRFSCSAYTSGTVSACVQG
jgi:hypothetical protein